MDYRKIMDTSNENPLETLVTNGGFCGILRKVGCIGDSLSSGEFESLNENGNKGYHDMYDYSWGQFMAREAGLEVLNFSRGGMSAKWYCDTFADENDFWNHEKKCKAYPNLLLQQKRTPTKSKQKLRKLLSWRQITRTLGYCYERRSF